jgi:hypothetical protein
MLQILLSNDFFGVYFMRRCFYAEFKMGQKQKRRFYFLSVYVMELRLSGSWQSLVIIEAPRNARRNSRTCTSTTREQEKAERGSPTERLIVSSIN